jgi:hypothetical protein
MDPNTTIKALFAARIDGDVATAQELARGLLGWLDRGGFPPEGFTIEEARIEALDVLVADPTEPDRSTPLADDVAEPSRRRATAQGDGRADR